MIDDLEAIIDGVALGHPRVKGALPVNQITVGVP
jgi:hypothetical protein